jgi:membrane fusion protein YbhG
MIPRWRTLAFVASLVVLGLAGFVAWRLLVARPEVPRGVIAVSGRIEGDGAPVATKTAGRILDIAVREGDWIAAGQVVAALDAEEVRVRELQAAAALREAETRVRLARHQSAVLNDQLRQSPLGVDRARADAQGRSSEAEGRLATAEAQLAQAEAAHARAKGDRESAARLHPGAPGAEQEARRAQDNERAQAALVAAARRQVEAGRSALAGARTNLVAPAVRSSEVAAVKAQLLRAEAEIAAAQADADRARAHLDAARANRLDFTVFAPFNGVVAARTAEPGKMVKAGTPVITLMKLSEVYLRAFVPEGQIGRVRVGQPARVYLDGARAKPIEARVSRVDPEASLSPENRARRVVGVKLELKGAVGLARPGMPAAGEILIEGSAWPARRPR